MKSTKSVNSSVSSAIAGEWETPDELFQELDRVYHFTLDACARPENAKCQKFFTKKEDGLAQDWRGNVVYCCPPSGTRNLRLWVAKGAAEGKRRTRPLSCCCQYQLMLHGPRTHLSPAWRSGSFPAGTS